ncbi:MULTISPECIES: heptaprenyl diphosphate synthase component II [Clostridia]|uniref:heptaprenyl diphosphate synthase component II n=1 Tax=Clostridia TaxID=186801 RepID=UPI000EA19D36|nr:MULTISPECIES: heptaprenyl diphosphate synthase component II [Clostridia]NBJ70490.1 heptaprenyl diphosphate synthase component II [Roseburia sp. 1XD42-34]RKI76145.1 heptaprenyl diphosphate synthase component II [Clostridium sp. 1xD42-85]
MKLARAYGYLKKDLNEIEQTINDVVQAKHPVLRQASTQLLRAGGKRIRPVFVLLAGQMGGYDLERLKTVAVSLELIHTATLVHDDVIDDADIRRGKPTIRKTYGNRVAMYAGDYILARALEEITLLQDPKIHRLLSKTIVEVCKGEIEQIKDKFDGSQGLRNYLRRIKRKTALLIATSCKLGAIASGLTEQEAHKLYRYGYNIGMSYQIIDDILDFTGSEKELGKPAGNDLLQGNLTLPVFLAMKDPVLERKITESLQADPSTREARLNEVVENIKETDAISESYCLSDWFLEKALKQLEGFPDSRPKQTLLQIGKYIGKRRA